MLFDVEIARGALAVEQLHDWLAMGDFDLDKRAVDPMQEERVTVRTWSYRVIGHSHSLHCEPSAMATSSTRAMAAMKAKRPSARSIAVIARAPA